MRVLTKLLHGVTAAIEEELTLLAATTGDRAQEAHKRVRAHVKRNSLITTIIVSVLAHVLGLVLGGL